MKKTSRKIEHIGGKPSGFLCAFSEFKFRSAELTSATCLQTPSATDTKPAVDIESFSIEGVNGDDVLAGGLLLLACIIEVALFATWFGVDTINLPFATCN